LSEARRHQLANKLRAITGWDHLGFGPDAALQTGDKTSMRGSPAARELINRAIDGTKIIILEDASNRKDVVFSRVIPVRWNTDNQPVYIMQIDFADFDHLIGDKAALKAFDVGWGFLHELDHVVNDSADADALRDAGECEAHINQMRRECNLPLRAEYFYTYFPTSVHSDFKTRFVRLAFDQQDVTRARQRRYWVMWDAATVGVVSPRQAVADLKRSDSF
jgi:hypothetical protein